MKTERRKYKRINEENRAIIRLMTEGIGSTKNKEIFALTQDISKNGAKLLTDVDFSVGTVFKTTVVLSKSEEILKFDSKVKWIRTLKDGESFEIGVEFMDEISKSVFSLIQHVDRSEQGISTTVIWV